MRQVRLPMKNIKVTDKRIRISHKTDEEYAKLKKSIKQLGLSNPIIVTTNLELIGGFWRLKVFIDLHNDDPTNEAFLDIPTLIVSGKEESEDLKMDFMDGYATDFMRDTAVDRLDMIYDPREFHDKLLHEYLEISEIELEHRLEIGRAVRSGEFQVDVIEKYRNGKFTHSFLYDWIHPKPELVGDSPEEIQEQLDTVEIETPEPKKSVKFDIKKWI